MTMARFFSFDCCMLFTSYDSFDIFQFIRENSFHTQCNPIEFSAIGTYTNLKSNIHVSLANENALIYGMKNENTFEFFQKISKGWLARQLQMGTDAQNADVDIFHGLSGELPLKWNKKPIKKIVSIHDLIFVRYPEFYSFFDRKMS